MNEFANLMPPTLIFLFLFVALALVLLFPSLRIIFPPYTNLGIPLVAFGLFLTFWVDWCLKKKKTAVKPKEKPSVLLTEGVFRFSRHPMYLGFVSWLLGLAILTGNLMAFFAPLAAFLTFEKIFIPLEEKNLEKKFGKKYKEYQESVRRWL